MSSAAMKYIATAALISCLASTSQAYGDSTLEAAIEAASSELRDLLAAEPTAYSCVAHRDQAILYFDPSGKLLCDSRFPDQIAEDALVHIYVVTRQEWIDDYRVSITTGKKIGKRSRGSFAEMKKTVTDRLKKIQGLGFAIASPTTRGFVLARVTETYGPFHVTDISITVENRKAHIKKIIKFPITQRYRFNYGIIAAIGLSPGTGYEVADGAIVDSEDRYPARFYVSATFYPRGGWGGRYFTADRAYDHAYGLDRLGLTLGLQVPEVSKGFYLGIGIELLAGFHASFGWQPRKRAVLKNGYTVGQPIAGDTVPVDHAWDWSPTNLGVGVMLDEDALEQITSFL